MNQQKTLLASIARTDEYVRQEQLKLVNHRYYFANLLNTYQATVGVLLLVPFIVGWRLTNRQKTITLVKQIMRMALLSVITVLRKWYLPF